MFSIMATEMPCRTESERGSPNKEKFRAPKPHPAARKQDFAWPRTLIDVLKSPLLANERLFVLYLPAGPGPPQSAIGSISLFTDGARTTP